MALALGTAPSSHPSGGGGGGDGGGGATGGEGGGGGASGAWHSQIPSTQWLFAPHRTPKHGSVTQQAALSEAEEGSQAAAAQRVAAAVAFGRKPSPQRMLAQAAHKPIRL